MKHSINFKAMEEQVQAGKTRFIGLSNFNINQIKDILQIATIKPICNQFEVNPLLQNIECYYLFNFE